MKLLILSALLLAGCATPQKSFRAIGHRGAAAHAPENTRAALEAAKRLNVYEVELDIQLSADRQLVLFHDDQLSKKTSSKGAVREHTAADLSRVDIGSWYDKTYPNNPVKFKGTSLTTLQEVLKTYEKSFYYHIEIKAHDAEIPMLLIEMLRDQKQLQNVTVTSFDFEQVVRMRTLDKKIPLCLLVKGATSEEISREIKRAQAAGLNEVAIDAALITEGHVKLAHQLKLGIRGYGVKGPEHLRKLMALDVYGSTLDHPEWVK